ncbi:MAG TPA: hypothetical protein VH914_16860, partial [Acidimicrobiia bacterium]|nr:hypothetical protein [Acidimicrobiia bacterium]
MLHARRALVVLASFVTAVAGILPAVAPTAAGANVARPAVAHPVAHASAVSAIPQNVPLPTLGYWLVGSNGSVYSNGSAGDHGSAASLARPIVGMAPTPSGQGYWMVGSDGGIFSFGDAGFRGSTGAIHLAQPIVGIASTPSGHGYWMVASDGGIFSFGDAKFHGSTGAMHLNQPIVGMAATPSGNGYWLVARDGGVFSFGDATFHGSTGAMHLNQPIVGMAASHSGSGYWMVASDGGVFSFGDATFHGSTGAVHLAQPIVGMAPTRSGAGYWFVARDGGVFSFGDAHFFGSAGNQGLTSVVGMAASNATGSAKKLAFLSQPSDATGGVPFATQPVVEIQDAHGNLVSSDSSIVTLSLAGFGPASPSATLSCDDLSVAAVNGVATFSGCEIDHTGSFTLGASDGSLSHAVSEPNTISVGEAVALRYSSEPSGAVHGVALGDQPVVRIVDAGGNTVTGNTSAVTLALTTPAGATLTCTTNPKTAVAGVATFAGCAIDNAGAYTLTATDGSLTSAVSDSVDITGAAAKLALTVEPSATASGGAAFATQPVVTVEDTNGHRIVADESNVTLALTSAGGATLSCTTNPVGAVAGVATFAGCKIDHSGTYTLTATDGSLTTAVSTTITVSTGAASQLAFTTQPSGSTGGTALGTQPVVTVEDAGGNAITGSSAPVTLALTTPGGATLTCTTNPVNATSGVATFAGCDVDHANTYTLTAASSGLTSAVSDTFTVTVGAASTLAFTTQPAGATGGTAFTSQPVVAVQDLGGNTITSDTSNVTLALTSAGGATLSCTTNPNAAVAGVATFAGCAIDLAGTYTLTATDGSLTSAVSASITNAVGAASQLTFTTQPVGAAGGAAFATQPVVTVQDAGGNTVATDTSNVTLAITTPAGANLTCTANPRAAIAGVATFAACTIDRTGNYTLTASDGSLTDAVSSSLAVTPGTATQLAFTTEPGSSGTGGTALSTQPVVSIEDSLGNTVTSNVTAVTLAITTPAGATLACDTNPQNAASGVATFAGCNIDQPGTYTLTASDGSLADAVSTSVVITVGPASQVTFTTQPSGATAGVALGTQPVVTIQDAGGNTVTSDTSSVTLALTNPAGATLTCSASPLAATEGVATFAGCNVDLSGTFSLTATDGLLSGDVSSTFTITAAAASQVVFTTAPGAGTGGTAFTNQPEVAIEDAFGNIVRSDTSDVTLAVTSPSGGTLSCATNPLTAVEGVATFANCSIDHTGVWTVTASDGSLTTDSTDVAIAVGDPALLVFSTQPSSATGGTAFTTQPVVTVEDAGGNTVTTDNSAVTLNLTSAGGATLSCTTNPETAVSGVVTFAGCAIDHTGTYTLTATDGTLTSAVSSSLTITVGGAAQVAFTTQPSGSTGGAAFSTQPVVAVQDAGGNTVTTDASSVSLALTSAGGATLSCTTNPLTAVSGVATFAGCAIDLAGSYTLTASDASLGTDISSSVTISVGDPAQVAFTAQPSGSTGGTAFATQPEVSVEDAGGNVVTGDTSAVTLTITTPGGALLDCAANPVNASAGVASFSDCAIDLQGTYTLTATDGSLPTVQSDSLAITVGQAAA